MLSSLPHRAADAKLPRTLDYAMHPRLCHADYATLFAFCHALFARGFGGASSEATSTVSKSFMF
jgi:hypothetical protein